MNRSEHPVDELRIARLDAPAVYSIVACWYASPSPGPPTSISGKCSDLPVKLGRGQEVTLGGTIRASGTADPETAGLLVEWTSDKISSSHDVILGQLSSDSFLTYWLETHTVLVSFFGVAALGLIGYLAKRRFDAVSHQAELKQAQERETWNQLLSEAGNFSLNYYLPADGALQSFIGQAKKHRKSEPCKVEKDSVESREKEPRLSARMAFYYWAYFERRMLMIQRRMGGVHFKDYTGEEIVTSTYTRYRNLCYAKNLPFRSALNAMIEEMPLKTTITDFFGQMDGAAPFPPDETIGKAWSFFHSWLHDEKCERALASLELMHVILEYELNRPYYHWYGSMQPLALEKEHWTEALSLAEEAPKGAKEEEIRAAKAGRRQWEKTLREYLARSDGRSRFRKLWDRTAGSFGS